MTQKVDVSPLYFKFVDIDTGPVYTGVKKLHIGSVYTSVNKVTDTQFTRESKK